MMKTCIAILLVFALPVHDAPPGGGSNDNCIENQARLLFGSANFFGIVPSGDVRGAVQVCEGSRWKHICDGDWTLADATVACRQLGHGTAASNGSNSQIQPNGLSYIPQCSGTEQSISDCRSNLSPRLCVFIVAVSCWNRSKDSTTTTTSTTTSSSSSSLISCSYAMPLTPYTTLSLTSQSPVQTLSTGSPAVFRPSLEPVHVVYGLTVVATVVTMSTVLLVVCMMWTLARTKRRHRFLSSTGSEVRGLKTNPAYQTTARLIPSSSNVAYDGMSISTQPVHIYEDVM